MRVADIRQHFKDELAKGRFATDKTGVKTIELLGASFIADEQAIFGKVNTDYAFAEIQWYTNLSTNINDIHKDKEPPEAWKRTANKHGEINSNYGHLIYSDKYFNQYDSALAELLNNPDSRRAIMIYNRPSMWVEYNENGKNDFICTNAVSFYIREGRVNCVVQMRSNDVVFGYKNDRFWHDFVLQSITHDLNHKYDGLESGDIYWQVQNLHVYSRHFHLVDPEYKE